MEHELLIIGKSDVSESAAALIDINRQWRFVVRVFDFQTPVVPVSTEE